MRSRLYVATGLAVVLVTGLVAAPTEAAPRYRPAAAKPVPNVPVKAVPFRASVAAKQPTPASARPAPVWPKAGLSAAGAGPVRVSTPSRYRVETLDRATTERAGLHGVLARLRRSDGLTAAARTKVTVDYKAFATAYGGDWSSRLRLVSLPACALTTPAKPQCAATPLASSNDVTAGTVSADLGVSGAQMLVAAEASSSGPAGDYSATSLKASSAWDVNENTGSFDWSYPLRVPPALGGPAPQIGLSYSSQSVDGQHAASNNQPSWIGEGFSESLGGFIERRYVPCGKDMDGSANNDKKTGDLCWETDNATLSLPGHSGELIYNAAENRWHLRGDDGSRIERRTGATNGDNNGEYWVLTTSDGVQYWFGAQRLPGWSANKPVTASTLTAPVFGNDPNEPCHATAFTDSDCVQAWRWNLDYVVDPLGNSMSYWYQQESNKYGRNLKSDDAAEYDRAAWLDHIDYGTRQIGGVDNVLSTTAPMRVDFDVADRCLSECGTHDASHWPDVPWDQSCTGDSCKDDFVPTFWTTKRLTTITTQVRSGTGFADVERWALTQTFPDPGDGTRAGLWLSKLSHTGLVGGSKSMPDIEFTPVQMPNRVDTIDFAAAMNWMRIAKVRTESGGTISVVYSDQDCQANDARPVPQSNTRRCYPVRWEPEGYSSPVTDWFNKYVVTTVYENDNTGGVPPNGSPRVVYSYQYLDGAAWHYTDDDGLVKKQYKTWSDYRGYGRVITTTGDAGEQTAVETRFFRGMNGDRRDTDGGTKPASVDGIPDEDWFAGMTRETRTLNGPNGAVIARKLETPWASAPTASRTINGDTVTARFAAVGTVQTVTPLDGGRPDRVTRTVTSFDDHGMATSVDDQGVDGVAGDERCIKTDYTPRNTGAWILDRVHTVQTYAVKCADTTRALTDSDVMSETRTLYDAQAYKTAPTKGQPTEQRQMSAWNNGAPTYTTIAKKAYDVHGRATTSWDSLNAKTTVAYRPATDGPVTSVLTTNTLGHATTTTLTPAWGSTTATVDPNGKQTDLAYDPLGLLTEVHKPGLAKAALKYSYAVNDDAPTVVTTSKLNPAGDYVTSYQLFDGLLRPRQTQAPSASGGRVITETFYDTAGRQSLAFDSYHTTGDPSGMLLAATDRAFVPRQNHTVYDGAGRTTAVVFQPYGLERWRTTTAYTGDRTDVTPPAGGTATSTVTDARDRTVELRQYNGGTATPLVAGSWDATTYQYDRRGYQTSMVDPLGNDWGFTYDIRGRKLETDDPDKGKTTFTYDNAGNVLTQTDANPNAKTVAYLYDTLGRKRASYDTKVGGTLRAEWIYDTVAKGQLSQSTRMVGSAAYQTKILDYNDRYQPRTTQIIIPASETGLTGTYNYTNTYYDDDTIKSTAMPSTNTDLQSETLTFGYDKLGLPTSLDSLNGMQNLSYIEDSDYNALGELEQIDRYTGAGGHVYTAYDHELETGRVTGIRTDRDVASPSTVSDTHYRYDAAGNILQITDAAPDPADDTQCFTYDNLRRLTQAWTPAAGACAAAPDTAQLGGPAPYWQSWVYDAIGNRTKEVVHKASGDAVTDYAYPGNGATVARPHAVTGTTGATTGTYTYDADGNMLTRPTAAAGTQTMTWDPEGHLETATDTTGKTTYLYDADGNRMVRRDPTGSTLYLPGQEIRYNNFNKQTSCVRYYQFNGSTIAQRTTAGLTWLASDTLGTAQIAVDAGSQQATVRRQTPFGTPRGSTGTWPNDKGLVGGTNDNTGLTHLGAREYDPALGRFVSVDPIQDLTDPQQWNAYAYANNNPVTMSDPSGLRTDNYSKASDTWVGNSSEAKKIGQRVQKSQPTRTYNFPVRTSSPGLQFAPALKQPIPFRPITEVPAAPPPPGRPGGGSGLALIFMLVTLLGGDAAPDPYEADQAVLEDQERKCAGTTNSLSQTWNLPLDDQDRARGGYACLSYSAASVDPRAPATPPGWRPGMERGHLIARQFGGVSDPPNIVPMYVGTNQSGGMKTVEEEVRRRLNRNERVFYSVIPLYHADGTDLKYPVPYGLNVTITSASGYYNHTIPNAWD